jgi:hypothetical protein
MELAQIIFLLGGHDLEMAEIRRIVEARGIQFYDYNLEWNTAKLSAYGNVLNNRNIFVGVELTLDITPPENYIIIDHHNENSHKSSSLEQVIEFLQSNFGLEIEMTRDLQLVAANDKGYIPAMLKFGASPDETDNIRKRDRKAQGATENDELLAEQSI